MRFGLLRKLLGAPAAGADAGLHPPERFRALIEREYALATRDDHQFSILLFDLHDARANGHIACSLAELLRDRLRSTDEAGWFDDHRVGVLLPATGPRGAHCLGETICSTLAPKVGRLRFAVQTYPESPDPGFGERSGEGARQASDAQEGAAAGDSGEEEEGEPPRRAGRRPDTDRASAGRQLPGLVRPVPWWKRAMDILLAATGLLLFAPLMFLVAVLIKLTSPGSVLYVEERTGQRLRRFRMYKFRSMVADAPQLLSRVQHLNEMNGPLVKIDGDPRVTPLGRILRRTSLDELPQLWNVLRGDMTLIGPRALSPLPEQYEKWQLRRFTLRPGIACEWQAERRSGTDFVEWMRSDLRYVDRFSFWRDLRVLVRTILTVLRGKGAR